MNKLEGFILFHAFKLPAALLAVAFLCILGGAVLFERGMQLGQLAEARQKVDMTLIHDTEHLLDTNATVAEIVAKAHPPTCRILATNPAVQIAIDPAGMTRLEKIGLGLKEAVFAQGKLIVTLQQHPATTMHRQ